MALPVRRSVPLRRQSEIEDFGALLLQVLDGNTPLWGMATTALGILRRNPSSTASLLLVLALMGGTGYALSVLLRLLLAERSRPLPSADTVLRSNTEFYDVCVVGACPAGSTAAYYLSQTGKNVLLVERERLSKHVRTGAMPLTPSAQKHMKEMGVLQEILSMRRGYWLNVGGLVSPSGLSFIGNSVEATPGRVLSATRGLVHEMLANAARRAGVNVVDGCTVRRCLLSPETGLWEIHCSTDDAMRGARLFRARVLIAADGAESALARRLGVVTSPPNSSVTLIQATSHSFKPDGVVFVRTSLGQGYLAAFKSRDQVLNLGFYSPQPAHNPAAITAALKSDPILRSSLGENLEIASVKYELRRTGGIPKSYGRAFLTLGGAAGHGDPLTGMGTQYGLEAAKIAADTVIDALTADDLSEEFMRRYQTRCNAAFGWDFFWSRRALLMGSRFPALLDALTAVIQRNGTHYLAAWAMLMTGGRSKLWCCRPDVAAHIALQLLLLWLRKKVQVHFALH